MPKAIAPRRPSGASGILAANEAETQRNRKKAARASIAPRRASATLEREGIGDRATAMLLDVPVTAAEAVSVAVMVCVPALFKVAEKVPTPFVSVEFAGRTA